MTQSHRQKEHILLLLNITINRTYPTFVLLGMVLQYLSYRTWIYIAGNIASNIVSNIASNIAINIAKSAIFLTTLQAILLEILLAILLIQQYCRLSNIAGIFFDYSKQLFQSREMFLFFKKQIIHFGG